jgi:hypothetical protein
VAGTVSAEVVPVTLIGLTNNAANTVFSVIVRGDSRQVNAHQRRLWERMITVIDEYKVKGTGFSTMVGELEGNLDAGEFRDQALVDEWYRHWTDLEVIRATAGDSAGFRDVSEAVETMQQFLRDRLVEKRAG